MVSTRNMDRLGRRELFTLVCRASLQGSTGLEENDRKILKKLQKFLRLDPKVAKGILNKVLQDVDSSVIPTDPLGLFRRAAQIAWKAGQLEDQERRLLSGLAAVLKLTQGEAKRILDETYQELVDQGGAPTAEHDSVPVQAPSPPSASRPKVESSSDQGGPRPSSSASQVPPEMRPSMPLRALSGVSSTLPSLESFGLVDALKRNPLAPLQGGLVGFVVFFLLTYLLRS